TLPPTSTSTESAKRSPSWRAACATARETKQSAAKPRRIPSASDFRKVTDHLPPSLANLHLLRCIHFVAPFTPLAVQLLGNTLINKVDGVEKGAFNGGRAPKICLALYCKYDYHFHSYLLL